MMSGERLLLANARLLNGSSDLWHVTVQNGRVSRVSAASAEPPHDQRVDLAGRVLCPGLCDNHVHFTTWTASQRQVSLAGLISLDAVVAAVGHALDARGAAHRGEVLSGYGLQLASWTDDDLARMTAATLDAAFPDAGPIALFLVDLHSGWVNSAMLALRNLSGNGIIREQESYDTLTLLSKLSEAHLDEWCSDAALEAAKRGVTEIVELEMGPNIATWQRRAKRSEGLRMRVRCGMYSEHLDDAIGAGLKSGDVVAGTDGLVTVGPFKLISDGSLGTRNACCEHAYPHPPAPPDDHGTLNVDSAALRSKLEHAIRHGLQFAVHAIGDRANKQALDVIESLLPLRPLPGSSIEHAQLLRWEDVPRFSQLGISASMQPEHLIDDRELLKRYWPGQSDRALPMRSLLDAGATLKLGSDAPVAPLDPWRGIAAAVMRGRAGEEDQPDKWQHPEQRITVEEALRASTSTGQLDVQAGDVADLCVLEHDPLTVSIATLRTMPVRGTLLAGRWTWCDL